MHLQHLPRRARMFLVSIVIFSVVSLPPSSCDLPKSERLKQRWSAANEQDPSFRSLQPNNPQSSKIRGNPNEKPKTASFLLYGSVHSTAYWFADIFFGTPTPQRQSLIVDTGSSVTGFPCSSCKSRCGKHIDPPFDSNISQSQSPVGCLDSCILCSPKATPSDFFPTDGDGTPFPSPENHDAQCAYHIRYTEGSSLMGTWFEDKVWLNYDPSNKMMNNSVNSTSNLKAVVPFGCHSEETHLFVDQDASGILGLEAEGRYGPKPFVSSLLPVLLEFDDKEPNSVYQKFSKVSPTSLTQPLFSLCLSTHGGIMTIGKTNNEFHALSPTIKDKKGLGEGQGEDEDRRLRFDTKQARHSVDDSATSTSRRSESHLSTTNIGHSLVVGNGEFELETEQGQEVDVGERYRDCQYYGGCETSNDFGNYGSNQAPINTYDYNNPFQNRGSRNSNSGAYNGFSLFGWKPFEGWFSRGLEDVVSNSNGIGSISSPKSTKSTSRSLQPRLSPSPSPSSNQNPQVVDYISSLSHSYYGLASHQIEWTPMITGGGVGRYGSYLCQLIEWKVKGLSGETKLALPEISTPMLGYSTDRIPNPVPPSTQTPSPGLLALIDSGTTLTYIPLMVYADLWAALQKEVKAAKETWPSARRLAGLRELEKGRKREAREDDSEGKEVADGKNIGGEEKGNEKRRQDEEIVTETHKQKQIMRQGEEISRVSGTSAANVKNQMQKLVTALKRERIKLKQNSVAEDLKYILPNSLNEDTLSQLMRHLDEGDINKHIEREALNEREDEFHTLSIDDPSILEEGSSISLDDANNGDETNINHSTFKRDEKLKADIRKAQSVMRGLDDMLLEQIPPTSSSRPEFPNNVNNKLKDEIPASEGSFASTSSIIESAYPRILNRPSGFSNGLLDEVGSVDERQMKKGEDMTNDQKPGGANIERKKDSKERRMGEGSTVKDSEKETIVKSAKKRVLVPLALPELEEECWFLPGKTDDFKYFPDMKLTFSNDAVYVWRPSGYLYQKGRTKVFCLTIVSKDSGGGLSESEEEEQDMKIAEEDSLALSREGIVYLGGDVDDEYYDDDDDDYRSYYSVSGVGDDGDDYYEGYYRGMNEGDVDSGVGNRHDDGGDVGGNGRNQVDKRSNLIRKRRRLIREGAGDTSSKDNNHNHHNAKNTNNDPVTTNHIQRDKLTKMTIDDIKNKKNLSPSSPSHPQNQTNHHHHHRTSVRSQLSEEYNMKRRLQHDEDSAVFGSSFFMHHDIIFHLGNWSLGIAEASCPQTDVKDRKVLNEQEL